MSFLRKFCLILWKNWLLRKRHYIITALEIILPLFFTFILVTLRTSGGDNFKVTYVSEPTSYPEILIGMPRSVDLLDDIIRAYTASNYTRNGKVTIMFSPENLHTQQLMSTIKEVIEAARAKSERVILLGLSDEVEMAKMAKKADVEHDRSLFGGISFVNEFPADGSLPQTLHYRIRLRATFFSGFSGLHYWNTDRLMPFAVPGPNNATGVDYLSSQFLLCQHLVALKFIELAAAKPNLSEEVKVYSQKFPYPPYYEDEGFTQIMQNMLPFFIILSYIFISPSLIKRIVVEKELGTKELMKLMGLPGWIQWLGWFVSNFIMMAISALIIVMLLCFASQTPVLSNSAPELVYFILLLYIASAIAFCFFISSLFSKPTLATAVGVTAWILTYSIPYDLLTQKYEQLSLCDKMFAALLPNLAMGWAIRVIASFEGKSLGLQWGYLAEPAYKGENMCMLHVMLMFVIDTILYGTLTWYIDNVLPGKYGVRKPWYFFVTKSYWGKQEASDVDLSSLSPHSNSPNFEKDPVGLTPTIVIKNLTKSYNTHNQSNPAVDNLSLNFYEGQITALLGHNGAGKTTTMSMLTGMFSPTKGTATINGYDIKTQIDSARESIGLCPQHNMLFDILTVSEHLQFFGKLKRLKGKFLTGEVDCLLKKLQLWEKRDALAKDLSGGMKRKLNLGISLIGGSKVVMLDEPTSGLDPEARRAIWDLLQEIRVGRCVILTTHFMEEADVLGDRIAIMAEGKLKCSGTPYFLKKRFGAGYHLNISKTINCNIPQLSSLIQNHLPDAYMNSSVNNEISYTLPAEKTSLFPSLFEELENNVALLGVQGFGVSVTTMEEVFLKVGSMSENDNGNVENGAKSDLRPAIAIDFGSNTNSDRNTGAKLVFQQLYGLLLKRWHYAYRRWILLAAQVVMPVLMVYLALSINNKIDDSKLEEPALLMDIKQYGSTMAVENHDSSEATLAASYRTVFPPGVGVNTVDEVEQYLIKLGEDSYESYRENHIVAAKFLQVNGTSEITALYNGVYLHSLPLAVNLVHNTLLHEQMNSENWTIAVENAPLPVDPEVASGFNEIMKMFKSMMMGIFIPIGLSFLSSSFVVFPIQERTSKSKHLQLMTGVGGSLFWGASFLWDYLIHFASSCLILIVFATMDDSKMFSGKNELGVVFCLLVAYGWAAIPFSYMVSFICKLPASGFAVLSVLNMIAGMILSMMIFFFKMLGGASLQDFSKYMQWLFRLLPNFTVTVAFMNMPQIAINNNKCDLYDEDDLAYKCYQPEVNPRVKPCCPDCGSLCLIREAYFGWDFPGVGQEVFMLFFDGFFYFLLLFLVERGVLYRAWYGVKGLFSRPSKVLGADVTSNLLDSDVIEEQNRIKNLFVTSAPSDDALLVQDLTKQFWSLRAVDHLSFGVKNAECFGLLGINGAGKTTTFRMLTGDEVMTNGEAFLHGVSLKSDPGNFLKKISYCPQFDALLDHLTGRETLLLFARLRGIPEAEIKYIVNNFIYKFDLTQHADKITVAYSGGNKRKLSAAIAFLGNSPMVFLDEPTTGVDPVARRKLWSILLEAKEKGMSLILTSHSMEECEVLCDRLAIMVNGQFKCLGGIQHLKNKFGQGFTVIAKMSACADPGEQTNVQQQLQQFMTRKFPGCVLHDEHQGLVHYHITDVQTPWRYLFSTMEEAKQAFNLEDYSVSQTSLEQVFLSFARQQWLVLNKNSTAPI